MLPCEMKDRKFDINYNIESSIIAINKWFMEKSKVQKIQFDKNDKNKIDITFIRVNKTMEWFDNKIKDNEKKIDVSDKIKNIIFNNKDKFNNFDKKKFIIFFEGWERRKYINYNVCGKSNYDGKIAIYFTASRFKKYIGDDIILKNKEFTLQETSISPFEIQKADEVLISNAIIGIQPVTSYKKKGFNTEVGKKIANNLSVLQIAGV